jgi:hypothetical protein
VREKSEGKIQIELKNHTSKREQRESIINKDRNKKSILKKE